MKKSSFGFGLGICMLLAVVLNFISQDAAATEPVGKKVPCHSSSTTTPGHTFTRCTSCAVETGIGSDASECRPNSE